MVSKTELPKQFNHANQNDFYMFFVEHLTSFTEKIIKLKAVSTPEYNYIGNKK